MGLVPMALDSLDVARWQFGITTVYHFILVPLTIGLSPLVALMETLHLRTGKEQWRTAAHFFGNLLLINFALGVATGIVQEFQFGMNWSEYSRFVGNIFGAPLAFEALLAFFMESTFLGLWIFGRDRLSPKLHNLCIWMVALGTNISAFFILAANSWMQHPVGAVVNPETGRAELDGIGGFFEVLGNKILWVTVAHVISSAFLVAGALILGVSAWWMVKAARAQQDFEARHVWRRMTRFGAVTMLIAGFLTLGSGHVQGQLVAEEQPAKMAAAEMLCETESGAGFTVAAFGSCADGTATHLITVPYVYSFMATNDPHAEIMGLNDAQEMYAERYGAGVDYTPNEMVTFWSFRLMIGLGTLAVAIGAAALWLTRRDRLVTSRLLGRLALGSVWLPFVASSFGWIMTEIGRQPWVVVPNLADPVSQVYMLTADGVSSVVSSGTVLTSLIVFTLLYAALGVIWFLLLRRYVREGVQAQVADAADATTDNGPGEQMPPLSFQY
ncbi:cytochrome ubiquinol oxidase subunit I [Actinomyces procaprae]|uniref:cytochrome ubiquinol oxidase subunit I n=1 Tax=Actinomyces procaprae TaxID=2560010 RepID=UPI00109DEEB1|nr:cytochrome ubiquinol oxidase subunit I [Actinomyces procaprae]